MEHGLGIQLWEISMRSCVSSPWRLRALRLAVICGVGLWGSAAMADAIHPRWIGVWFTETKQRLGVSEQQFNPGTDKCKWVGTRPAKPTGCVAFYDGSVSKAQVNTQLQQAEKAALEIAQKQSLPAADLQSIKDDFKRNRQVLDKMPPNVFRVVKTMAPEDQTGAGPCGDYFFIDQHNVYSVMACEAAPDAFSIKVYKKE
jgi:hypothetical protein